MTNTPPPPLDRPVPGASDEENSRYQDQVHEQIEWMAEVIQSLVRSKEELVQ